MSPTQQRLWIVSRGAADKVASRLTRGAPSRNCWERRVSFVHSTDPMVAMEVHDCGYAGGGSAK